jgi:hypothetical protein
LDALSFGAPPHGGIALGMFNFIFSFHFSLSLPLRLPLLASVPPHHKHPRLPLSSIRFLLPDPDFIPIPPPLFLQNFFFFFTSRFMIRPLICLCLFFSPYLLLSIYHIVKISICLFHILLSRSYGIIAAWQPNSPHIRSNIHTHAIHYHNTLPDKRNGNMNP